MNSNSDSEVHCVQGRCVRKMDGGWFDADYCAKVVLLRKMGVLDGQIDRCRDRLRDRENGVRLVLPFILFSVSVIVHVLPCSFFLSFSVMEARLCVGLSDGDGYGYADEEWH